MNTSKIIKGAVSGRGYSVTAPIIKEDYGLILKIEGIELPSTYEVDFSNNEHSGGSITMIGNSDGVRIPKQFIKSGKDVFAFLYHVGADFGRTVYKFRIPNKIRPDRTEEQPTPEQQSVIDQTIAALNEAVAQTAQDVQTTAQNVSASATNAQTALNASFSASANADRAEQARDDAQTYANNASTSATASAQSALQAQTSAQTATQKADSILNLTASARTLPEGSSASASYNAQTGVMNFGIPKGDKGNKGETGNGIENTVLNLDYTLTITFTDGTSYTTSSIRGEQGLKGETGASGVYIGDTEPTDEGINVWIDTSDDTDDKSSPIVGVGQAGYMIVASDTSDDKSSPIVGVGQVGYMKI